MTDTVRMHMTSTAIDVTPEVDSALEELLAEALAVDGKLGGPKTAEKETAPFPLDIEVVRPRALSLRRLYAAAGKELPAETLAALGPREPILVSHGMTPFFPAGRSPQAIWGMGYTATLIDGDADTVALAPRTELLDIGRVEQTVRIGLDVGGKLGFVSSEALTDLTQLAGITLPGAEIEASTKQSFQLSLKLTLQLLKVQSGPVGTGGARWNLYRQDERLDGFQQLLQTMHVRRGTKRLVFEVSTWAKTAGLLFGIGAQQWKSDPARHEVAIDG